MTDSKPVRRRKIAGERRPGAAQPHRDKAPAASDAAGSSILEAPAALAPTEPRADDLPSRPIPNWLLGGLAVLLVVAVAYDLIIGFRSHTATAQRTTQSAAITAALDQAPTEAETAATHILAYDYKTLQHDADEAKSYMTPDYAEQFQRTVDGLLKDPADQVKAHVGAAVKASGVVSATPAKVDVMMFIDQTSTTTAHREPQTYLNRVVFTMVRAGERWLVSDVTAL
ncbi:MAG: hypothetical protein WBV37_14165 [Nocardioidaceae bacterium]